MKNLVSVSWSEGLTSNVSTGIIKTGVLDAFFTVLLFRFLYFKRWTTCVFVDHMYLRIELFITQLHLTQK